MNTETSTESIRQAYRDHLCRRQSLQLCKQLIKLAIELQKHRGCTLAILSGDLFFETQVASIQRDITEQLNLIEEDRREFFSLDESMQIIREWICIRRQWRSDSPEENFLLHSNLIAELLKLIRLISKRSELDSLSTESIAFNRFCLDTWLNMIEIAAQVRGLATHCAVKEETPAEIGSRLKFLKSQLEQIDQQFNETLDSFEDYQIRSIREFTQQLDYHVHLNQLIRYIDDHFRPNQAPGIDVDAVYTAGSHVISDCQQILSKMLRLIENYPDKRLASWIDGSHSIYNASHQAVRFTPMTIDETDYHFAAK